MPSRKSPPTISEFVRSLAQDAASKIEELQTLLGGDDREILKQKLELAFWCLGFYAEVSTTMEGLSVLKPLHEKLQSIALRANEKIVQSGRDAVTFYRRVVFLKAKNWEEISRQKLQEYAQTSEVVEFLSSREEQGSTTARPLKLELILETEFKSVQFDPDTNVRFEIEGVSLPEFVYSVCLRHCVSGLKTTAMLLDLWKSMRVGDARQTFSSCDESAPMYVFEVDERNDDIVWFSMEEEMGSIEESWIGRREPLKLSSFIEQAYQLDRDYKTALESGRLSDDSALSGVRRNL